LREDGISKIQRAGRTKRVGFWSLSPKGNQRSAGSEWTLVRLKDQGPHGPLREPKNTHFYNKKNISICCT
jgi:hypothetical protein